MKAAGGVKDACWQGSAQVRGGDPGSGGIMLLALKAEKEARTEECWCLLLPREVATQVQASRQPGSPAVS